MKHLWTRRVMTMYWDSAGFSLTIEIPDKPEIIKTNTNDARLEKFFRVMQLIEIESLH